MKRGLKAAVMLKGGFITTSSNLCPDEKGTERSMSPHQIEGARCSNLCPDEKGTERVRVRPLQFAQHCSNLCPDEKGTESCGSGFRLQDASL